MRKPITASMLNALVFLILLVPAACTSLSNLPDPLAEAENPQEQLVALEAQYTAAASVFRRIVADPSTPEIVLLQIDRLNRAANIALEAAHAVVRTEGATPEQQQAAIEAAKSAVASALRIARLADDEREV